MLSGRSLGPISFAAVSVPVGSASSSSRSIVDGVVGIVWSVVRAMGISTMAIRAVSVVMVVPARLSVVLIVIVFAISTTAPVLPHVFPLGKLLWLLVDVALFVFVVAARNLVEPVVRDLIGPPHDT